MNVNRSRPALLCFAVIALVVGFCVPAWARVNVLFILVDDMGWGDLGANGGAGVPTPHMDRLAAEGTRFTQFYTASPICSASRCGFLTGQYPARWRITSFLHTRAGNRASEQVDFLDPAAPNFVRAFKEAGYRTAHIGKWHLGGGRDVVDAPKFSAYGYDVGLGTYESPEPAAPLGLKSTPWAKTTEPQQVKRHERTRWMVDETLKFVKAHAEAPWLVNLWLDDVHTPFVPSDEQAAAAGEGVGSEAYRAVLRATDAEVGRLLDGLRELKQDANTLVILAGDNGPEPSFHRKRTAGMRGMKWSLYEGGIRTPLVVRCPGTVPVGVNTTTVVGAVDFLPTLCALAGVPAPAGVKWDGADLSAAWKGDRSPRPTALLWEYGRKPAPDAPGKTAIFRYPAEPEAKSPNVAIRDGDWKLLIQADGSGAELYHLATDLEERNNVLQAEPQVAERLKAKAMDWRKSLPRLE